MEKQSSAAKLLLKRQLTKQLSEKLSRTPTASRQGSNVSRTSLSKSVSCSSIKAVRGDSGKQRSVSSKLLPYASIHVDSAASSTSTVTTKVSESSSTLRRPQLSNASKRSSVRSLPQPQLSNASARSNRSSTAAELSSQPSNTSLMSSDSVRGARSHAPAFLRTQPSNVSLRTVDSMQGKRSRAPLSLNSEHSDASMAAPALKSRLSSRSSRTGRIADEAGTSSAVPEGAAMLPEEACQLDIALVLDLTEGMHPTLNGRLINVPEFETSLQNLFIHHPGVRVGIVLHADINSEYRACLHQFSHNAAELMQFLKTGAMQRDVNGAWFKTDSLVIEIVQSKLHWDCFRRGIVIMVADVMPHDVYHYLQGHDDRDIIDWKTHSDCLLAQGVKLYALQMYSDPHSADFWREWLRITGGHHVLLNGGDHHLTSKMITAMCAAEMGPEVFQDFESKVRDDDLTLRSRPELFDNLRPHGALRPKAPLKRTHSSSSSSSDDNPAAKLLKRRLELRRRRQFRGPPAGRGGAGSEEGAARKLQGAAKKPQGAVTKPQGPTKKPQGRRTGPTANKGGKMGSVRKASKGRVKNRINRSAVVRRLLKRIPTKAPTPALLQMLRKGSREEMKHSAIALGKWSAWKACYSPFPPSKKEAHLWKKRDPVFKYYHDKYSMKQTGYRRLSLNYCGTTDPSVAFFYEFALQVSPNDRRYVVSYSVVEHDKMSQNPDDILFNHEDDFSKIPINLNHALAKRLTVYVRRCAIPAEYVERLQLKDVDCYAWIGNISHGIYPRRVIHKRLTISHNVFY